MTNNQMSSLLIFNERRIPWERKSPFSLKSHILLMLFVSPTTLGGMVSWVAGQWIKYSGTSYLKFIYDMNPRDYFSSIFLFSKEVLMITNCISKIPALWCWSWIDKEKQVGKVKITSQISGDSTLGCEPSHLGVGITFSQTIIFFQVD